MAEGAIRWLMQGDPAISYQCARDLIGEDRPELQARIAREGWGARYLAARHRDGPDTGHWGRGFYCPKWTSTHYTLLDLRNLCCPATPEIRDSVARVLDEVNAGRPSGRTLYSDTCINGMVLNYGAWFGADMARLAPVVDFLIADRMADGGFNCRRVRSGAHHSSLHSTLSVLEGLAAYRAAGHDHRIREVDAMIVSARAFILIHRLFRSDRTGAVINQDFLRFPAQPRWYYNILRALDHFAQGGVAHDARMDEAVGVVLARRKADGLWRATAAKAGERHFAPEPARAPSRIVTLAALRVLKAYAPDRMQEK
jgi:hypothetical protein